VFAATREFGPGGSKRSSDGGHGELASDVVTTTPVIVISNGSGLTTRNVMVVSMPG
jgi:hypothetical protein